MVKEDVSRVLKESGRLRKGKSVLEMSTRQSMILAWKSEKLGLL